LASSALRCSAVRPSLSVFFWCLIICAVAVRNSERAI